MSLAVPVTRKTGFRYGVVVALCLAMASPAPAQLPALGSGTEITTSAERRAGDRIAREIRRDPDYLDDAVLMHYLDSLWGPLRQAAQMRGDLDAELSERFAWELMLIRDRSVNAFALPGGYFGVHLGLITLTQSRDELASVLAHELSHVTQRHIPRLIGQQNQQTPWMVAAMVLAAVAVSRNPEMAKAAVVGSQALAAQSQLNFSRDMEREADRLGLGILHEAGFDAHGMSAMFERLQHANRINDSGNFPYLRSHPLTTERIAAALSRTELAAPRPASGRSDALTHSMMAARARALADPGVDALRGIVAEVHSAGFATLPEARRAAGLYGAALASVRLRDLPAALVLAGQLEALVATDSRALQLARWLVAEIHLAGGAPQSALTRLDLQSVARPEVLMAADARTRTGDAQTVAQALRVWVADHPNDAAAWMLLAAAYDNQGQRLRAIRAEAEARVAQGDLSAASDRFKAAQDLARGGLAAGDHIEASIIDSRARQVELLLREQALER
jgi:predicted Zn-dependent protease